MLSKNYLYIFIEYNIQDPDPRPKVVTTWAPLWASFRSSEISNKRWKCKDLKDLGLDEEMIK